MSLKINLDTNDYDVRIRVTRNAIVNFTPRIILEGGEMIHTEMRNQVPVKTGELRDSIQLITEPLRATISTNSGYGKFVDEDTSPHIIEGNPILRFMINGVTFFRRRVFHTGTKGQQFRRKTLDIILPRFPQMFGTIWKELTS